MARRPCPLLWSLTQPIQEQQKRRPAYKTLVVGQSEGRPIPHALRGPLTAGRPQFSPLDGCSTLRFRPLSATPHNCAPRQGFCRCQPRQLGGETGRERNRGGEPGQFGGVPWRAWRRQSRAKSRNGTRFLEKEPTESGFFLEWQWRAVVRCKKPPVQNAALGKGWSPWGRLNVSCKVALPDGQAAVARGLICAPAPWPTCPLAVTAS